jgi:membrane-bound lytic murein transglycosylase D
MKLLRTVSVSLLLLAAGPAFAAGGSEVRNGLPTRTPEMKSFIPAYDNQKRVRHWMNYLRGVGHLEFRRWTRRMGHYASLYQKSFRALGLPPELVWLSGMESGCDRNAVSHKGAGGLWQFLAATGRAMGLRVDKWVDERFDPEASTMAAARHLHGLYKRFKKWPLVLAAYHAGERWVARAIKRYKTNDYFKLARHGAFQAVTNVYVPKALAFIALASSPEEFGVKIGRQPEDKREDLVMVPPGTKLQEIAEAAKIPYGALRHQNPALRRAQVPPKGQEPYHVRLPWGTGWRVVAGIEGSKPAKAREAMTPIKYVVKAGDSIWKLARRFGVKMQEVLHMNGIVRAGSLRVGQELILPPMGSAAMASRR